MKSGANDHPRPVHGRSTAHPFRNASITSSEYTGGRGFRSRSTGFGPNAARNRWRAWSRYPPLSKHNSAAGQPDSQAGVVRDQRGRPFGHRGIQTGGQETVFVVNGFRAVALVLLPAVEIGYRSHRQIFSANMTVTLGMAWRNWLEENLTRGCSVESVVESMVNSGFDKDAASAAVLALLAGETPDAPRYEYDPSPVSSDRMIHAYDRAIHPVLRVEQPQLILFGNVLSTEECDQVIELSEDKLQRSTIIDPDTGRPEIIDSRSSENTAFQLSETPFIDRLDRRISALMNRPLENGEGLQVVRYGVGGEFRSHFDYFPPDQPGHAAHLARGGQRTATLVVYLNDVESGGDTVFPNAGISISPRKGQAVYFRYFNNRGQLDPMTEHAGAPVLAGEKWIMTKWMRRYRY